MEVGCQLTPPSRQKDGGHTKLIEPQTNQNDQRKKQMPSFLTLIFPAYLIKYAMQESNILTETDKTLNSVSNIVTKYDTSGAEEPDCNDVEEIHFIHHDKYGFIDDLRFDDQQRQSSIEKKGVEKERSREEKWIVMITDSRKWFTAGEKCYQKMIERVWKVRKCIQLFHIISKINIEGSA